MFLEGKGNTLINFNNLDYIRTEGGEMASYYTTRIYFGNRCEPEFYSGIFEECQDKMIELNGDQNE